MTGTENADRFTGLAEIYAAHRPNYPAGIIDALANRVTSAGVAGVANVAIDVGCGTGIATAALAKALPDWRVIAAEPNDDMLSKARQTCAGLANVEFVAARAEQLPADNGEAGLVLAAQALHWFDRDAFFADTTRALCVGGTLAVLYNNRLNEVSAVLSEIEDYLESIETGYHRNYRDRDIPAMLAHLPAFENADRAHQIWLRPTSSDDLVNYFMSRSMMQPLARKVGIAKLRQRIGDIADLHARAGMIDIPFATELDMATRC